MQWAVSASVVPVVLRHDELVKVDEREVLHAKHVAVEAVVERREESLCADLRLRRHVQLPLEDGESDTFGRGVPVEHARHLVGHGVVVEGEVGDAEQAVQLEELDQLARLVVHEVDGLDADAHRGRVYFVLGDRVVPVEHWHQVGRPFQAVFSNENAHGIRDWDVNDRRFRVIQGTEYKRGTVLEVPVLSDGPNRRLDDDDVALRAPSEPSSPTKTLTASGTGTSTTADSALSRGHSTNAALYLRFQFSLMAQTDALTMTKSLFAPPPAPPAPVSALVL